MRSKDATNDTLEHTHTHTHMHTHTHTEREREREREREKERDRESRLNTVDCSSTFGESTGRTGIDS